MAVETEDISKLLNESGNIDHDKLEEFLLGVVDKMENGKPLENDVKTILSACCKLWREKESWKQMYYNLYERYSRHLDDEIERYNKMLGRRSSRHHE